MLTKHNYQLICSLSLIALSFSACGTAAPNSEPGSDSKAQTPAEEPPEQPKVQTCSGDSDCQENQACSAKGICTNKCSSNADCADSCQYCSSQTRICEPFPKGEKIGSCSGEFQQCDGLGSCECTGNHAGTSCTACKEGWTGQECNECDSRHFGATCEPCNCKNGSCNSGLNGNGSCSSCQSGFTGTNCDQCAAGYYGPECKKCECGSLQCNDGIQNDGSCYSCPEGFTGVNCDECLPGHFGSNCNAITCKHGEPSEGINGNGHCTSCEAGYYGLDCDKNTISCVNGTPKLGITGDGKCSSCLAGTGWSGENCDQCTGNYYSADCDKNTISCVNGTPKLGITGDGKCSSCLAGTGWSGENCDQCTGNYWGPNCNQEPTCQNGTPKLGITGDGKCSSCLTGTGWSGENCDSCTGNYWGKNCNNIPSCVNGTPYLGIKGDGKCLTCNDNYYGEICNKNTITCVHGNPHLGPSGTGQCIGECNDHFTGPNCNQCTDNYYGLDCNNIYGSMTDQAGNTYKTVIIGEQEWMAENIAYQEDGITCYANTKPAPQGDPEFIEHYGCLYKWEDAQKVCPIGWHLPEYEDFSDLLNYVACSNSSVLRASSWNDGQDTYGFGALPAGVYGTYYIGETLKTDYIDFGTTTYFWSNTVDGSTSHPTKMYLDENIGFHNLGHSKLFNSVRCIKNPECRSNQHFDIDQFKCICNENGFTGEYCDEPKCQRGTADPETGHCLADSCDDGWSGEDCDRGTLTAYGYNYKTVLINGNEWMAENMNTSTANGVSVVCIRNSQINNFWQDYGCLYSWFDARKVCPSGWHLPTKNEFDDLLTYVGKIHSNKILTANTWDNGKDTYGFEALPAGFCYTGSSCYEFGDTASFWSATKEPNDENEAMFLYIQGQSEASAAGVGRGLKSSKYSVRCVKDNN